MILLGYCKYDFYFVCLSLLFSLLLEITFNSFYNLVIVITSEGQVFW